MHQKMARKTLLFIVWLCMVSSPSIALHSDKNKMLHGNADSVDFNQQTHEGLYQGHVHFSQGTTELKAALATTKGNEKNEIILAIAKGDKANQAHFTTKTDENKPPMHAFADAIHYFPKQHKIELRGNAKVTQGPNTIAAPLIQYDTLNQRVITKNDGTQRTQIVFYPEKKS